jgi:hypothetical protein
MAAKRTHRKHYFLLRVSAKKTIRLGVKARNATSSVILSRTLGDVAAGTEGMSITCANAECALRQNGETFPHPVYLAEFTDNRAYIVDKLNKQGVPTSCVVYAHNQGKFQKQFDTKGKRSLAKMSGAEGFFVLSPIRQSRSPGKGVSHGGTSGPNGKARKTQINRGAIARAARAGIVLDARAAA